MTRETDTMVDRQEQQTLDGINAARLAEFARACRAAVRAVSLYPPEHPAIAAALTRLADACSRNIDGTWHLGVVPGALLLDGRRPDRTDPAASELADALHRHHVGALMLHQAAEPALWAKFLRLVTSAPEDLQRQGGLARLWATAGGRLIELREIDYAAVLRDAPDGESASWDVILRACLQGDTVEFDERTLALLAEVAGDAERLIDLARRLEDDRAQNAVRSPAAALLAILERVLAMLAAKDSAQVSPVLDTIATAAARLSPDVITELLASRSKNATGDGVDLPAEMLARFTDTRVAGLVSNSVIASHGATARLATAFFALVPEPDRRRTVLHLAHENATESALAAGNDFERIWQGVEALLGSYTDEAYVSSEYAKDLATARVKAADADAIDDDPPERIAAWLATVTDASIRALDLRMLLDLLAAESDAVRWREVADVAVAHVEDLLLVGDFDAAAQIVTSVSAAATDPTPAPEPAVGITVTRETAARNALDRLLGGAALAHISDHLQEIDDAGFEHVKQLCLALGPGVIGPLAELLAVQERARARQRLTALLLAFGSLGRQCAEQLKNSSTPSVRRVAVYLLREFGGSEALPDLASLLDDAEPHVQRDAVRAILLIGTDEAYSVLDRALKTGSSRSRGSILRLLDIAGDERAAPLLAYIVRHGDHRKGLRSVYLEAVAALGRLGGNEEAVEALKVGLYRGEWWAPRRTAALRAAAAKSLRQIGSPSAIDALREAIERGPRGVRAAARPHVTGQR